MAKLPHDKQPPRPTDPFDPPQRPGSLGRLAHYEVEAFLGRGAFGTVVRAFDTKLHRQVAIKLLSSNFGPDSSAYTRFLREARAAANVRHENVVQIYAVEETPCPYIVLEYIPGESLQDRLDRDGKLPVAEVLKIGGQVARGLAAAHECGLVHRDIKPCNILVETVAGESRAKIADFGLALSKADARLTQSGMVAGTPMYMAPEQASAALIDNRADLFSLGSVLYTMLAGQPPFGDSNPSLVLGRIVGTEARPIRQIAPHVPVSVCRVVAKLHAKRPEQRYQSGIELAEALAKCQDDPLDEPATQPPGRAKRNRLLLFAGLTVALVAGALALALKLSKGSGSQPAMKPPAVPHENVPATKVNFAELFASPDYGWGKPKGLGPGINTSAREASPSISADGKTLIFTRDYKPHWSKWDDTKLGFVAASPIFDPFPNRCESLSLSADALTLVMAIKSSDDPGSLWMSERIRTADDFEPPVRLPAAVNASNFTVAPALSADGLKLYATTVRKNGEILEFTRRSRGEPFGTGRALPDPVNTPEYETADWISPDGGVLFCTTMPKEGAHALRFHLWETGRLAFGAARPFEPFPDTITGHPTFVQDGMTVYFHARVPDETATNLDLWTAQRKRIAK